MVSPVSARLARLHLGVVDRRAARQEVVPAHGAGRHAAFEDHDLLDQVARAGFLEQRDVVGVEEVGDGEEEARARRAQHVRSLCALEAGVQGHEHAAGRVEPEGGDDPPVDVRRPHRGPVARLQTAGDERPRRFPHGGVELGEGEPGVAVDDRLVVGPPGGGPVHDPGHGLGQWSGGGAHEAEYTIPRPDAPSDRTQIRQIRTTHRGSRGAARRQGSDRHRLGPRHRPRPRDGDGAPRRQGGRERPRRQRAGRGQREGRRRHGRSSSRTRAARRSRTTPTSPTTSSAASWSSRPSTPSGSSTSSSTTPASCATPRSGTCRSTTGTR